jgi:hypothetical protein
MPSDGRHAHARDELAVSALGRVHRDVALQLGEPGLRHGAGVEIGDPAGRLSGDRIAARATPGDVAAVGDAEHAQRHPVEPHRVLVVGGHEDRAVGEPVEVGGLGAAALDDGVDRVLGAAPSRARPRGGEVGDSAANLDEVVAPSRVTASSSKPSSRWLWLSMMPGVTSRPVASIMRRAVGASAALPT